MDKKDWVEEMLEDNSEHDTETLEMISDNCKVLSGEQKNRILDIIREKENADTARTETVSDNTKDENVLSVVEFSKRKNSIVKICAALAACVCLVTGLKLSGSLDGDFIPSGDDSVKNTTVSETGMVTDNTSALISDPVIITVLPEKGRVTENSTENTVSDRALNTTETSSSGADRNAVTEPNTKAAEVKNEVVTVLTAVGNTSEYGRITEITADNKEVLITSGTENEEVSHTEVSVGKEKTERPEYMDVYKKHLDVIWYPNDDSYKRNANFTYILYDMNKDGNPDMIIDYRSLDNSNVLNFITMAEKWCYPRTTTFKLRDDVNANYKVNGTVTYYEDRNTGRLCLEILDNGIGTMISFDVDGSEIYEADAVRDFEYGDDYSLFREAVKEKFDISELTYGDIRSPKYTVRSGHDIIGELEEGEYYFFEEDPGNNG